MSSLLLRSLKCSQLVRTRVFLSKNSIYNVLPACITLQNYPNIDLCAMKQTQQRQTSTMPPKQPQDNNENKQDEKKKQDPPEYVITFKRQDIKHHIKQFYSLYGPLFLVCHIGIALTSLGFFYSLVWLNVDLANYIPDVLKELVGSTAANITGTGGKFIIAYAMHKLLLPFRLMIAISLTKFLSPKVKLMKSKIFGK